MHENRSNGMNLNWRTSDSADDMNHDQEVDLDKAGNPGGASWASVSPDGAGWVWVVYDRWLDVDAEPDPELARGGTDTEDQAKAAVAEWVRKQDSEPVVTVEGRNYYTVPSTGEAICPECGAARPAERIADHMASEHDPDCDDNDGSFDYLPPREHDMRAFGRVIEDESTGGFPVQGGECALGHHTETALSTALEDMRRVQRNLEDTGRKRTRADVRAFRGLDEDKVQKLTPREVTQLETALDEAEINHDTVKEQTGEDA
jgi:hypothetical protein